MKNLFGGNCDRCQCYVRPGEGNWVNHGDYGRLYCHVNIERCDEIAAKREAENEASKPSVGYECKQRIGPVTAVMVADAVGATPPFVEGGSESEQAWAEFKRLENQRKAQAAMNRLVKIAKCHSPNAGRM